MEVKRLNEAGCLWEGGRHWFVSEALAGEWVGLERLPLDTIAVRFRHMYVRELELGAQQTHSLVRPAGSGGGGADLGRPTGSRGGAPPPTRSPSSPRSPHHRERRVETMSCEHLETMSGYLTAWLCPYIPRRRGPTTRS